MWVCCTVSILCLSCLYRHRSCVEAPKLLISCDHATAGSKRASRDVHDTVRLRKATGRREHEGAVTWSLSEEPPRPSQAETLDAIEPYSFTKVEPLVPDSHAGDENPQEAVAGRLATAGSFLPSELRSMPASQAPHAASIQMAVNNCHMLQYRAAKPIDASGSAGQSQTDLNLITASPPANTATQQKGALLKVTPTLRSLKPAKLSNKVQPALVTITAGKLKSTWYACNSQSYHTP